MNTQRFSRRTVLSLVPAGAIAAVIGTACGDDDPGANGSTSTPGGTRAASGWSEPAVVTSKDGLLETTLRIAPATIPYEGGKRWALTVNGSTPGPTLRAKPGDKLRITLDNAHSKSTNLHTHGLHVSPKGNSDNPFIEVKAGEKFTYEIDIPKNHPGGLFWYHPHIHHLVAEQIISGYFGAIVIEDDYDRLPEVAAMQDRLILLHDIKPGANEREVTAATNHDMMVGREGPTVLVTGLPFPALEAKAGVRERWRILNASPSRFYKLKLAGHTFQSTGVDGGRFEKPFAANELFMVPGERLELIVEPKETGAVKLITEPVNREAGMGMGGGMGGGQASTTPLDLVSLKVAAGSALTGSIPAGPKLTSLAAGPVDNKRELTLSMQGMNVFIDGRTYDGNRVDVRARLNTTEEWTIRNTSEMDHPFHIHVWPFQVVEQSAGTPAPGWKDVVNVPAGGWVKFRIRFADYDGKAVYHCHILDHEDMGMMGVIEVTA